MRTKTETVFFCRECGYESKKWMGQCPSCHNWNTFCEEPVEKKTSGRKNGRTGSGPEGRRPVLLKEIDAEKDPRFDTGFSEFSRVLGGGVVPGSLVLVGGDPGIGKSTLLLQLALNLADAGKKVLYISGEESLRQIRLRADRIGQTEGPLSFLSETNMGRITELLEEEKVAVVPGTAFGDCGEGFIRISYAYSLEDLKEAFGRVERFIQRLREEKNGGADATDGGESHA